MEAIERGRLGQADQGSTLQSDLQQAQERREYEGQLEKQHKEAMRQINDYKLQLTKDRRVPLVKIA